MNILERQLSARVTEADFQRWVVDVAQIFGWLCHHSRPARKADGSWSTPITGTKGFVDLVLCHPRRGVLILAELKTDRGRLTLEQGVWLEALNEAGAHAVVWRPRDRERIEAILTGKETL